MSIDPEILVMAWLDGAKKIVERYPPAPSSLPEDPHEQASIFNDELARGIAFHELNERLGIGPTVAEFKAAIIRDLGDLLARKLSWGEELCIATAAFYRASFSLETTVAEKSPMLEAIVAADVTMRAVKDWKQTGRKGNLEEFISKHYIESKRDPDTPRKSIQRFRRRIQDKFLFHFNADTFQIEVIPHEEIMHGTSRKPGRPRKKS